MKQYVIDAFTDKVFGGNPACGLHYGALVARGSVAKNY